MSKTTFEKLGIPYEERDGIFYPVLVAGTEQTDIDAGKYGHMWIKYIKEEYPMRYKSLVRFGELEERANEVNETAYKLSVRTNYIFVISICRLCGYHFEGWKYTYCIKSGQDS